LHGLSNDLLVDGVTPPEVPSPTFTTDSSQDLMLLESAVQSTANHYSSKLSPGEVDNAVISAMANSVGDCHTIYFTPTSYKEEQAWIQGQVQFGGIGASLRRPNPSEPLVIWRVFGGTPAAKAGLRGGDVIRAVDGRDIAGLSVEEVVNLIRGPAGQPVRLTIQPAGTTSAENLTIVRAEIQPPNVEYRLLPGNIGYVQIYGFPENTASQFKQALDALDKQGATSWVFDLRDNGGGSLDAVTQVTSMFVPKDTLLYYLYTENGQRTDYHADGSKRAKVLPTVLLVNDGTGSGAEIFAAALAENGVAKVVGQTTAGCVGTGQLYNLPSGAGIQITVAALNTGRGKVLNKIGVVPDVPVDLNVTDLVAGRDPQLDRAVQLIQTGH
jgi:carboxyl-terminal processing protease